MSKVIKNPTLFCPTHPTRVLHTLKYQKGSGKQTIGGNRGTEWVTTDWRYCEECKVPVKVQVTVQIVAKAQ